MNIKDFVAKFHNHPVLFVGTGLSLRYLENSFSWDGLLKKVASDFNANDEYYLELKSECMKNSNVDYAKVASSLEKDFNEYLKIHRTGKFKDINDIFYKKMSEGVSISRFKLYIASLLKDLIFKKSATDEIAELKKARKNISSVITTNYDCMVEEIFSFQPLVGNSILLSNPYGSVYKIHGCISQPEKIIITDNDYAEFNKKYELIRAQLLSLFIHNPIIFIGYSIADRNIKNILKTIFSYVDYSSEEAKKIKDNFLLIEYEKDSKNTEVLEHDIDIEGYEPIRINKLKTDNFSSLFVALSNLTLPVSAMDIRKVQTVVKDICAGGTIQVSVTENLDELKNSDKVLVIGSKKTIKYEFLTISDMMINYFNIIDESNYQLLLLLNKQKIQKSQYFPIYAFSKICPNINHINELKKQQKDKIKILLSTNASHNISKKKYYKPEDVLNDCNIKQTYKVIEIIRSIMFGCMDLEEVERYLRNYNDKKSTNYRKLLCAFDLKYYE